MATSVYEHNLQTKVNRTNLETISASAIDKLRASIWLMSPPCQPYNSCVNAKKLDDKDLRSNSLIHLICTVLPALKNKPKYLLIENVKGFRTSNVRDMVVETLTGLEYAIQEVLLTPVQFGLPNQRLRYFLLAKKAPATFKTAPEEHYALRSRLFDGSDLLVSDPEIDLCACCNPLCAPAHLGKCLCAYLEAEVDPRFFVPDRIVEKNGMKFDIVHPECSRTCCFTKGYGKLVDGAGSVMQTTGETISQPKVASGIERGADLLPYKLRYFTPEEIKRLHGFPMDMGFPDGMTDKAKYRLLGNSLNCVVLSHVMQYLFDSE